MGILSQGSLSLNLSLASGDPESLGGALELSVVSVLWVQVLGHWHEQVTGCTLLLVGRLGQKGRMWLPCPAISPNNSCTPTLPSIISGCQSCADSGP